MVTRFIPVSIWQVPAALSLKQDWQVIAKVNSLLYEHGFRIQPLEPEQIIEEDPNVRCDARSPGGVTDEGILPRKGLQCGLPKGHDGEHNALVPTGAPWAKSAAKVRPKSKQQLDRAQARVDRMFKKANAKPWKEQP